MNWYKNAWNFRQTWQLHAMLIPGIVLAVIFLYLPMFGLVISFQDFKPWLGFFHSPWVGLDHFRLMLTREDSVQVIRNTFIIAGLKIFFGLLVPLVFSLLLNELRHMFVKRLVQTLVYLPHFMSWVILGGILINLLGTNGPVNQLLSSLFGIEPLPFLMQGDWFRFTVVVSDVWKEFGFGTILFLAALTAVNPSLYEAAEVDGASRWQQTWSVTIPSIIPIVIVLGTLSLGSILNAGFDQIFNLYNALVYDKGDIIDTFAYRVGLLKTQFSFGAAVGMFKAVISLVLIVTAYRMAYKFANYRIF
ncbi:protein lplB [Paenibacillus nasutitermitis]|uniref:Protein lplB n=2 Tax=Paenibacillus nasutitermitis TaxID=1652958 RepID=A0A917DL78_9BACL|nr:protein lplB [Paenibacillus nasutitermitis]